jgi:hypothetical protein
MADVISMKDWVPSWVRDSYMTEDEVNAFNEAFHQSRLEQSNPPNSLDDRSLLVGEAAAKLESIDRANLEKWLHRIPAELLVELIES